MAIRIPKTTGLVLPPLLLVAACASGSPPDEAEFVELLVSLVVDSAKLSGRLVDGQDAPKTVVLDKDHFPTQPPALLDQIRHRLSAEGVHWMEAQLGGDTDNLPGDWDTTGKFRINRTHVLLGLSITGGGRKRTVQWNYTCGPLCGYGERIEVRWRHDGWHHDTTAHIRY